MHAQGAVARGPFVAVNCGAFSETLLDSQLFGHRRGSFTGAIADQEGVFQAATRRHALPRRGRRRSRSPCRPSSCARSRSARSRRSARPGRSRSTSGWSRPPTATSRAQVQAGEFREDLFYRLNVVNIHLPPLRERRGDIPAPGRALHRRVRTLLRRRPEDLSDAARARLEALRLAGQHPRAAERDRALLRDLHLGHHRARGHRAGAAVSPSTPLPLRSSRRSRAVAAAADAPGRAGRRVGSGGAAGRRRTIALECATTVPVISLEEAERRAIAAALRQSGGNKNEAARLLRIDRQRLYRKIEKYRL